MWLAGSRVLTVTYHRTDPISARSIVERGVSIGRSRIGSYGQGLYTSTIPNPEYGDYEVVMAIRLVAPLTGNDVQVGEIIDSLAVAEGAPGGRITPPIAAAVRRALLRLGYDGIVVFDGDGDGIDLVVAIREDTVRVVMP